MAKIIEARALLTADDQASAKIVAMAKRVEQVAKANQQFARSGSEQMLAMSKRVDELNSKLTQIQGFKKLSKDLDGASIAYRRSSQEANRLKAAVEAAGGASGKLARDYDRAARAAETAKNAFMAQGRAVRQSRADLEALGIPVKRLADMERQLANQAERATAALHRQSQAARLPAGARAKMPGSAPRVASGEGAGSEGGGATIVPFGGLKSAGVVGALYAGKKVHDFVIENHHDFQRAKLYQQAVLGLDADGQASMVAQAEKIGKDTRFTNADIVKAQTDIGGKMDKSFQKPGIIEAITENTKNYALAMQVSMEEGADAIVGYMKSWGYDLSSPEAAAASSKRAANMLVQQAKTTGAKHHDLLGSTKFGAAPSRVGGFSEEMINAIQAQLIRVGYEGAMAGTFSRAVATKLAVPSRQGMAAIAGMGVDYNAFRKPGSTPATAESLSKMLQLQFGRSLGKGEQAKVQSLLDDPEVMGDKGTYTEKLSEILNEGYARRTKNGKVDVRQAQALTRVSDQFYNVISGGVDTQGLFMAIVEKGMNAAIARYLFGQEHGGRAIGLDPNAIRRDFEGNKNVPSDRAEVVANKLQEGAQGEWNQLIGSVQTFGVALGESTDSLRQWTYKGLGSVFDWMTDRLKNKDPKQGVGANMNMTPAGAPYRLDTWSSDAIGIYERSRRVDAEFRRDPEGARGRAMMNLGKGIDLSNIPQLKNIEAIVKDPVPVKVEPVELKGQATVGVTVKVDGPGQVTGMTNSSSGHIRTEGQALQGTFGHN